MGKLHDSQQEELLSKLLAFYKKRYSVQSEFEKKFNDAVEDLISTGDVEKPVYLIFCTENNIEPKIKKPTPPSSFSSSHC
jgi:hypothetical protein